MKFFSLLEKPFVWIGKQLATAAEWLPRIIKLIGDGEQDAKTVVPEMVTVFDDVEKLALESVKDSGIALVSLEALIASIVAAFKSDGLNIQSDKAVVTAFTNFIAIVCNKSNYSDIISAVSKLIADYDTCGAAVKTALEQLAADAGK